MGGDTRRVEPLAYTDLGARIAFYGTVVTFVVLEQRTRVSSLLHRDGDRADSGSLWVVSAAVAAGIGLAVLAAGVLPGAGTDHARWPVLVVGLTLMWTGMALRQWAVVVLGRFFTVDVRIQSGQAVVESGPYRWVRHPSYTGLLVTLGGLGVALGNGVSLAAVLVIPTVGLVVRIRVEERALLAALGEPYRRFAQNRARLIPGVW